MSHHVAQFHSEASLKVDSAPTKENCALNKTCEKCKKEFKKQTCLEKHTTKCTDNAGKCQKCDRVIQINLKGHELKCDGIIRFDTTLKNYQCLKCERTFITKTSLWYHFNYSKCSVQGIIQCEQC